MATLTGLDFYKRYGHPDKVNNLLIWDVPSKLEIGVIPKRIYCNADFIPMLEKGFGNLIDRGHVDELKTYDGVYNKRPIRGYEKKYEALMRAGRIEDAIKYLSIHSWAGAIDLNAAWNKLGGKSSLTKDFVLCLTDAGMEWGGSWKRVDPMHFQMGKLP